MSRVHVVVSFPSYDRILPRMGRELGQLPGWTVGEKPDPTADLNMYMPYLELSGTPAPKPDTKTAAYFTHIEPGAKARLWDQAARQVDLRIVTAPQYQEALSAYGPTICVTPPVDLKHFTPGKREPNLKPVVGVSGFVYAGGRKGEKLVRQAAASELGKSVTWKAAGKGWPVRTQLYEWKKLPGFYRSLDVYLCAATIEGVPMPPLEAMACGVRCVIPRGVGLLDELPDLDDLYRYEAGDLDSMLEALGRAATNPGNVDRDALRGAVSEYTLDNWRDGHARAFAQLLEPLTPPTGIVIGLDGLSVGKALAGGGVEAIRAAGAPPTFVQIASDADVAVPLKTDRGIYVVAYGEPARVTARRLMTSIRRFMPDIPTMVVHGEDAMGVNPGPLNAGETHSVYVKREDTGGRAAKVQLYDRAPAEWQYVLYLDADTELIAPVPFLFQVVEDGWDITIAKNPVRFHTADMMLRSDNADECRETWELWGTKQVLQWFAGVFAFRRNERTAAFFAAWYREWKRYAKRDQGALLRALLAHPLRLYPLGNEWNFVPDYAKPGIPISQQSAGIVHHTTEAREGGKGIIPPRGDSPEAFAAVARNARRNGSAPVGIVNSGALGRSVNVQRGGPLVRYEFQPGRYIRVTEKEAERLRSLQAEKSAKQVQNKMREPAGVLNK